MDSSVDRRGRLEEEPFDYQVTRDGRVIVFWQGKQVRTLAGKRAEKFLVEADSLDEAGVQLALAKVTGNFKHGNERHRKSADDIS